MEHLTQTTEVQEPTLTERLERFDQQFDEFNPPQLEDVLAAQSDLSPWIYTAEEAQDRVHINDALVPVDLSETAQADFALYVEEKVPAGTPEAEAFAAFKDCMHKWDNLNAQIAIYKQTGEVVPVTELPHPELERARTEYKPKNVHKRLKGFYRKDPSLFNGVANFRNGRFYDAIDPEQTMSEDALLATIIEVREARRAHARQVKLAAAAATAAVAEQAASSKPQEEFVEPMTTLPPVPLIPRGPARVISSRAVPSKVVPVSAPRARQHRRATHPGGPVGEATDVIVVPAPEVVATPLPAAESAPTAKAARRRFKDVLKSTKQALLAAPYNAVTAVYGRNLEAAQDPQTEQAYQASKERRRKLLTTAVGVGSLATMLASGYLRVRGFELSTGSNGGGAGQAAGDVLPPPSPPPPSLAPLPIHIPEMHDIPVQTHGSLDALGDNPWTESRDMLLAHGIIKPTAAQILEVDNRMVAANGWTEYDTTHLQVGDTYIEPDISDMTSGTVTPAPVEQIPVSTETGLRSLPIVTEASDTPVPGSRSASAFERYPLLPTAVPAIMFGSSLLLNSFLNKKMPGNHTRPAQDIVIEPTGDVTFRIKKNKKTIKKANRLLRKRK